MSKPIAGHKGRDQFLNAISVADLNATELRVALQLALFFNCTTGQCNPGSTKLADRLGVDKSLVKRALKTLEEKGWIKRRRIPDSKTSHIDLFVPGTGDSTVTPKGDSKVPHPVVTDGAGRVTQTTGRGDSKGSGGVTTGVTTRTVNNTESNTEKSAPPARSSARVERVDVLTFDDDIDWFEDTIPLNPDDGGIPF